MVAVDLVSDVVELANSMSTINAKIEAESIRFIKENKAGLIRRFASIEEYPPARRPVSVFMAGCPGAGKTEVSKNLIRVIKEKVIRIDADDIRKFLPQYNGKNTDDVQKASFIGVDKLLDHTLRNRQNFILDGTFSLKYQKAKSNIERAIRPEGCLDVVDKKL
ncbi:MAG: hypothetical protein A2666_00195 [Parcubacteria group bacterium RIFCSPHIGHO2_01_FULL_47_10b]|nr:MAG: hypothetical protein A2666_00195 [Parcubacteria group bacterium RIFCSPHIGHO2_01_FULL_47_10b]